MWKISIQTIRSLLRKAIQSKPNDLNISVIEQYANARVLRKMYAWIRAWTIFPETCIFWMLLAQCIEDFQKHPRLVRKSTKWILSSNYIIKCGWMRTYNKCTLELSVQCESATSRKVESMLLQRIRSWWILVNNWLVS